MHRRPASTGHLHADGGDDQLEVPPGRQRNKNTRCVRNVDAQEQLREGTKETRQQSNTCEDELE